MLPEASCPLTLRLDRRSTPIGEALIVTDETGALRAFDFGDFEPRMRRLMARHYPDQEIGVGAMPSVIADAVERYFQGDLNALVGLTWKTNGTEFQRRVWAGLCTIPAGTTLSYQGLASQVGSPKAMRAVGLANGANPIAVVVPCHRVIGASGRLTGYGGGLERKAWLLQHEGAAFLP
ncbi:MAG: methylated-DNA--protein-cysteine methyltransferase [Phenylobacterium zucineum]|nr:MAG: methylated-DNA--protein-cysteine methyltransferase [Phenylobacterium zucineum]